jgi:hypothetical protein
MLDEINVLERNNVLVHQSQFKTKGIPICLIIAPLDGFRVRKIATFIQNSIAQLDHEGLPVDKIITQPYSTLKPVLDL